MKMRHFAWAFWRLVRGGGGRGAFGAAVARAVGEAAVLAAQGDGATALALAVVELAPAGFARVGVVTVAKELAGESATGAGLALMERGTETWHRFPSGNGKGRSGERPCSGCLSGENSFFAPYYQDTKSSLKTGQISWRVLWWKWRGMRGHYFGFGARLLTNFPHFGVLGSGPAIRVGGRRVLLRGDLVDRSSPPALFGWPNGRLTVGFWTSGHAPAFWDMSCGDDSCRFRPAPGLLSISRLSY
jgi:hypothetical protein